MSLELLDTLEQLEMKLYEEVLGKLDATDFTAVGIASGSLVPNEITIVETEEATRAMILCFGPSLSLTLWYGAHYRL
jgi:hypothetical protein